MAFIPTLQGLLRGKIKAIQSSNSEKRSTSIAGAKNKATTVYDLIVKKWMTMH